MRATRAYITSFGTTGLLIASALLTLSVMSAFVAFNGFPGEDVQAPIQTLLVQQAQTQVPVPAKPVRVGVLAAKRPAASAAAHRAAVKHVHSPTASTGPVVRHTAPKAAPPASAPTAPSSGTSGGGTATPVAQTTPVTAPSPTVPSAPDPQLPPITLPALLPPPPPQPPPPGNSQLPIDTSSITGLLGGS